MEEKPLRTGGELEKVMDRYQNMVYGLALARTGSTADAEDVFQEVFLAYFRPFPVTGGKPGLAGHAGSAGELPAAHLSVLF